MPDLTFQNRRNFLTGTAALAAGTCLAGQPAFAEDPLPASIHTWFGDTKPQIYNYDVDVRITLPETMPSRSISRRSRPISNSMKSGDGGLQWVDGVQKINWGAGLRPATGSPSTGRTTRSCGISWKPNTWYRYHGLLALAFRDRGQEHGRGHPDRHASHRLGMDERRWSSGSRAGGQQGPMYDRASNGRMAEPALPLHRTSRRSTGAAGLRPATGLAYDGQDNKILRDFTWKPLVPLPGLAGREMARAAGFSRSRTRARARTSCRTVSEWMSGAVVWLETGWGTTGVQCTTAHRMAEPALPLQPAGVFTPGTATASYNGVGRPMTPTRFW